MIEDENAADEKQDKSQERSMIAVPYAVPDPRAVTVDQTILIVYRFLAHWSKRATHRLQTRQCFDRKGFRV